MYKRDIKEMDQGKGKVGVQNIDIREIAFIRYESNR